MPFNSLDKDPQLHVTSPAWTVGCCLPIISQERTNGSQRAMVCAEPLLCMGITAVAETLPSWGQLRMVLLEFIFTVIQMGHKSCLCLLLSFWNKFSCPVPPKTNKLPFEI